MVYFCDCRLVPKGNIAIEYWEHSQIFGEAQIQNFMNGLHLDQLKFETDTWRRVLNFISEENAHLKSRFSSILKADCDVRLMEHFEAFQTQFVGVDAAILAYKKGLSELDLVFLSESKDPKMEWAERVNRVSKLKDSIVQLQKSVFLLIWDFHRFLDNDLLRPSK